VTPARAVTDGFEPDREEHRARKWRYRYLHRIAAALRGKPRPPAIVAALGLVGPHYVMAQPRESGAELRVNTRLLSGQVDVDVAPVATVRLPSCGRRRAAFARSGSSPGWQIRRGACPA
jgi:hypothetical protein